MKRSFTAILRCTDCGSRLAVASADGARAADEITAGALQCSACRREWPIVMGIPRFVASDEYARNFSLEWTRHARTQLDDETCTESEATFVQTTGLEPADLSGKLVLDVGCGMGRFSDVATRWGATVVGIDLSRAVESAYSNLGTHPAFHVAQADILSVPFAPSTFDVVFSIGVLHHTPNPEVAFHRLPSLLKPGGRIAIWVYDAYNPLYKVSDFYRKITTRLPSELLYTAAKVAGPLYPLYRFPVIGLLARVLLPMSPHPKKDWRVLDTFDWYAPKYQWKHTYAEVFRWFSGGGLEDITPLDYPVAMSGRKPVNPAILTAHQGS
jgi:SAM-dependent methyltransferase